jgi:hypothetical protein
MAGDQGVGVEIQGRAQQVAELDGLVAAHAGNGRLAPQIGVGEIVDDRGAEAVLEVDDVVRDADGVGHPPGIVDILAGTAGAGPPRRLAVVVELHGYADHVVAFLGQQGGGHRAVDAARHGDDDAGIAGRLIDVQAIHAPSYGPGHS